MDARAGTASLTMTNTGQRAESYRIELVDMIYRDDGKVVPSAKPPAGYPSAKNIVRFSPSQVRLEAGQAQTVRILLRTQERLPDGEYRVHAVLKQLPNVTTTKPAEVKKAVAGVIGVEQGVAIPVIVRRGVTSGFGKIASIQIVDSKSAALDLQLARTGNQSLYTNLLIKDQGGKLAEQIKGVALPVPNPTRRFFFPLRDVTSAKLRAGGYTLEMVDHDTGAVIDKKPVK